MTTRSSGEVPPPKAEATETSPRKARDPVASAHAPAQRGLLPLTLGALGVVYGDIGTSPLYALKECVHGPHAVAATDGNILSLLSLIFWSVTLVVSIKYLQFITRADNAGEGGVVALLALVPKDREACRSISERATPSQQASPPARVRPAWEQPARAR